MLRQEFFEEPILIFNIFHQQIISVGLKEQPGDHVVNPGGDRIFRSMGQSPVEGDVGGDDGVLVIGPGDRFGHGFMSSRVARSAARPASPISISFLVSKTS